MQITPRRALIATALLGALLLAGLGWLRYAPAGSPGAGHAAAGIGERNDPVASSPGSAVLAARPSASHPADRDAPTPAQPVLSGRRIAELQLTRQLAGEHRFIEDGRAFQVLGSKETVDRNGVSATMVVIVDETSGQIRHHLPGLQFSLKPGLDHEAFIREQPGLRRLFVNPIYAQVAVDAAQLAAQYQRLRQDPRVERLRLMTRDAVRTPK